MQFDRGYLSPYFINTPDKQISVLENPYVLLSDKKISMSATCCRFSSRCQGRPPLLIIAEEVESEALATLVVNNLRGIPRPVR